MATKISFVPADWDNSENAEMTIFKKSFRLRGETYEYEQGEELMLPSDEVDKTKVHFLRVWNKGEKHTKDNLVVSAIKLEFFEEILKKHNCKTFSATTQFASDLSRSNKNPFIAVGQILCNIV